MSNFFNYKKVKYQRDHASKNVYFLELSKRVTWSVPARPTTGWSFSESTQPDSLIRSQKNSNPACPTTVWWVKRVGSHIQLIKKNTIFYFFQSKLNYNSN